jgi:hypothetical protein
LERRIELGQNIQKIAKSNSNLEVELEAKEKCDVSKALIIAPLFS